MWIFTPRYLKHAKLLHKAVTRFINYKRDLLPPEELAKVSALRDELTQARKNRDRAAIEALDKKLNEACEQAMPSYRISEIAENVEVFFVAIAIALGIRAYIAQPFQIPTASMQPTLNGYMAEATEQDPTPNILKRLADKTRGLTYYNVTANHSGYLRASTPEHPNPEERNFLLFSWTELHWEDGYSQWIWCPWSKFVGMKNNPEEERRGLGFTEYLNAPVQPKLGPDGKEVLTPDAGTVDMIVQGRRFYVKEGQLLARGILHTGDSILVNRFSYHFRKPERGEVFVFTTRNINGIHVPEEQGSQHYIKRLVGTPGDTLQVKTPELWINGKAAEEFGMKRVAASQAPYRGYESTRFLAEGRTQSLKDGEYWAMGDNSYHSSDSRYWGVVPQRNIVGPALFCYWPPVGQNWGPIK